jgi:hypothetical protein
MEKAGCSLGGYGDDSAGVGGGNEDDGLACGIE